MTPRAGHTRDKIVGLHGEVLAGFEDADSGIGVLSEARRHNHAGRASADDDVVERSSSSRGHRYRL